MELRVSQRSRAPAYGGSGVMSSPSDIVSLDSQHDSTRSKDKWGTDQEDCSDQDLAGTPEPGPPKSPLWERSSSENRHLR